MSGSVLLGQRLTLSKRSELGYLRGRGDRGMQVRVRDLVASGIAVYNPQPFFAGIAQLVERVIRNDEVVGSIPISGTIPRAAYGRLAQR